jgi:hypothetical protein
MGAAVWRAEPLPSAGGRCFECPLTDRWGDRRGSLDGVGGSKEGIGR